MAYVGGRSGYLPGQKIFLPVGVCCDEHTEVKAMARIVGECDSFGYEAIDMCEECYQNFQNTDKLIEGVCDWCKSSDSELTHKRDPDEGTSGPVYKVCAGCIKSHNEKLSIELENDNEYVPYVSDDDGYYDSDSDFDLDTDNDKVD